MHYTYTIILSWNLLLSVNNFDHCLKPTKITLKNVSNCLRFIKHSFNKVRETPSGSCSGFDRKCSTIAEKDDLPDS